MTAARWLKNNYKPTIKEYLHTSTITVGYSLCVVSSYIGMGNIATKNIFKWARNEPKLLKAGSIIYRLMDDIVSNEERWNTSNGSKKSFVSGSSTKGQTALPEKLLLPPRIILRNS
ncbi:hypothetical protein Fmac_021370 [Flemingia macrophylla]|uniref:Terpene synthase metal-binding domain-containing protein n=1 Tax=Flemingia macrophylla TaxID=520843 RepID=A0ABD1LWN0_9FABA